MAVVVRTAGNCINIFIAFDILRIIYLVFITSIQMSRYFVDTSQMRCIVKIQINMLMQFENRKSSNGISSVQSERKQLNMSKKKVAHAICMTQIYFMQTI